MPAASDERAPSRLRLEISQREGRSPALSIDQEIGIQHQHCMPIFDFGHAYDACIG